MLGDRAQAGVTLTVMCWNRVKVDVPWLQAVLMLSALCRTEPLCHSQRPSGVAYTT